MNYLTNPTRSKKLYERWHTLPSALACENGVSWGDGGCAYGGYMEGENTAATRQINAHQTLVGVTTSPQSHKNREEAKIERKGVFIIIFHLLSRLLRT